jgi:polysaccharide biosynthesis/export protein
MTKFYLVPVRSLGVGALIFLFVIMLASCGNTRQLIYMQGKFDTAQLSQVIKTEPVIQKGDLISIIVYSDNLQATAIFNQPLVNLPTAGGSESGGGSGSTAGAAQAVASPTAPGYLVDDNGNIQFPRLGLLHLEGITRDSLRGLLDSRLKDTLLVNPYYSIRFLNYKFTMLGEVSRPGIFTIPGEHISLLEALGLAGDITFYGRRDNVLIIREINGKRQFQRLDLTKPDIMASPYFYLQQGDVVYVEPNKKKVAASDQVTARNISIGLGIVSAIAVIIALFRN